MAFELNAMICLLHNKIPFAPHETYHINKQRIRVEIPRDEHMNTIAVDAKRPEASTCEFRGKERQTSGRFIEPLFHHTWAHFSAPPANLAVLADNLA